MDEYRQVSRSETQMNKESILSEMRRVAKELGTDTLGKTKFANMSGITEGIWLGKYWASWTNAVNEAGLKPGLMTGAHDKELLLESLAALTQMLGHFPTAPELKMEKARNRDFPNHNVFGRLGNKSAMIEQLRQYASSKDELSGLLSLLPARVASMQEEPIEPIGSALTEGFVYMLKLGKHYKIGKTYSVPRRHREITLELPERPDVVHSIRTDDPDGIEAYWHRRFAKMRTNGEWFALGPADVRAFRQRKTM